MHPARFICRMQEFLIDFTYVGIVLALVGRGVGLPLPEDIALLTVGFLCAKGMCDLRIVMPLAWICIVLADSLSFMGGRLFGHHLPHFPLLRWVISHAHLERAKRFYARYGNKALIIARALPGIRSPLYFIAGSSKVSPMRFLIIDLCIAPLNVILLVLLGWYFPQKLSVMKDATNILQYVILGVILTGVIILIIRRKQITRI